MQNRVFQQIADRLFDQHGVHRQNQHLRGHLNGKRNAGIAFGEFGAGRFEHLLGRFWRFVQAHALSVGNARNGKQVFYQPDQPFAVLTDPKQQFPALFGAERFLRIQQRAAGTVDGGQRRAQIMGYGAQQIGAHFFFFNLCAQRALTLDPRGERAVANVMESTQMVVSR